jgi:gamma-glutamyltranspeptidase/glutathione hydrolase
MMVIDCSKTKLRSTLCPAIAVTFFCAASLSAFAQDGPESASARIAKSSREAKRFMIVAANPLAADAGYEVLKAGGSAVDAAIAAQLVLNVVEPQSSGIGGGAFMLHHDAKRNRLVAYDGRETAPTAARPDRFLASDGTPIRFFDAVVGGRSVGVPGTVALLALAHERHGRLPWASLFGPAVALAEKGFAISPRLAALIAAERSRFVQERARAYFLEPDGNPRREGSTLRNPAFAATLRAIAAGGAEAFYRGAIARDVVATANAFAPAAGDLALSDLAGYKVRVREPVCAPYRGFRVCGMPLPSSGGPSVLQMLGMLEPYDVAVMGPATFWSVHFLSEAGRLAFADRDRYMADPDFTPAPAGLLDRGYLRERSRQIHPTGTLGRAEAGDPPRTDPPKAAWGSSAALELPSTTHLSIVDAEGNAVAMTSTIEWGFGSHLMTESGFLLNNELTDFSFAPTADGAPVANRIEPGKRPRSSMAPTIVYDASGRVHMLVGSAGGPAIINEVLTALIAVLDWGLDAQAAVALPHFGSRNGPTELEAGTDVTGLAPKLEAMGHATRFVQQPSGLHAILRTKRGWQGGADPRREGVARGD